MLIILLKWLNNVSVIFLLQQKMPPRNYSLKDKKYAKYNKILYEDTFNILS